MLGFGFISLVLGSAPPARATETALDFSLAVHQPEIQSSSPSNLLPSYPPTHPPAAIALSFNLPPHLPTPSLHSTPPPAPPPPTDPLFDGDADSLVAKAVGSAEGTRTPDGGKTAAYYGHVDPGNGAWNLGSFSYQHGARSPVDADRRQLRRLRHQAQMLRHQAQERQMQLTLAEELNGIDLANQSPAAALDRGYLDWLKQAQELGMSEPEGILWARTRSFLDPDSGRWNAPGLGNNVAQISHDQERRMQAIARTLIAHKKRSPKL